MPVSYNTVDELEKVKQRQAITAALLRQSSDFSGWNTPGSTLAKVLASAFGQQRLDTLAGQQQDIKRTQLAELLAGLSPEQRTALEPVAPYVGAEGLAGALANQAIEPEPAPTYWSTLAEAYGGDPQQMLEADRAARASAATQVNIGAADPRADAKFRFEVASRLEDRSKPFFEARDLYQTGAGLLRQAEAGSEGAKGQLKVVMAKLYQGGTLTDSDVSRVTGRETLARWVEGIGQTMTDKEMAEARQLLNAAYVQASRNQQQAIESWKAGMSGSPEMAEQLLTERYLPREYGTQGEYYVGQIIEGEDGRFRFKGGNERDRNNYELVK